MLPASGRALPGFAMITIVLLTIAGLPLALFGSILSLYAEGGFSLSVLAFPGHFLPLVLGIFFYLKKLNKPLYITLAVLVIVSIIPILASFITYSSAANNYLEQGWLLQYWNGWR